jgi:hypothetical protein
VPVWRGVQPHNRVAFDFKNSMNTSPKRTGLPSFLPSIAVDGKNDGKKDGKPRFINQ